MKNFPAQAIKTLKDARNNSQVTKVGKSHNRKKFRILRGSLKQLSSAKK